MIDYFFLIQPYRRQGFPLPAYDSFFVQNSDKTDIAEQGDGVGCRGLGNTVFLHQLWHGGQIDTAVEFAHFRSLE